MARKNILAELLRDKAGATAIEYGLILGLIAVVIVTGLQGLSGGVTTMWDDISTKVTEMIGGRQ